MLMCVVPIVRHVQPCVRSTTRRVTCVTVRAPRRGSYSCSHPSHPCCSPQVQPTPLMAFADATGTGTAAAAAASPGAASPHSVFPGSASAPLAREVHRVTSDVSIGGDGAAAVLVAPLSDARGEVSVPSGSWAAVGVKDLAPPPPRPSSPLQPTPSWVAVGAATAAGLGVRKGRSSDAAAPERPQLTHDACGADADASAGHGKGAGASSPNGPAPPRERLAAGGIRQVARRAVGALARAVGMGGGKSK